MRKLVFYPEIVGFIEEEKEKFPTVKVNYVYNSPPKLMMLDDDGQHKETIRSALFTHLFTVQCLEATIGNFGQLVLSNFCFS